jgi:hypothetical protein
MQKQQPKPTLVKSKHSKELIEEVCSLRKKNYSYSEIGKKLNITKNLALSIAYKHFLKIDKNIRYKKKKELKQEEKEKEVFLFSKRVTVPYVPGLSDTSLYVVDRDMSRRYFTSSKNRVESKNPAG